MTYGRTINSQTFMDRTANHSTKGSRRGFVDVETGVNVADLCSWEQRRDSLVKKKKSLERSLLGVAPFFRARIGLEIQEVDQQLRALKLSRPERRHTFDSAFNLCAKQILAASEYERIALAARGIIRRDDPA